MTFGPSVCFAMLTVALTAHAQTLSTFQVAYVENQIFKLRDAVEHAPAPLFYRAAVEASSNRVQEAETDLRSIIHAAPHSSDAYEAHDLLANMYFRNGMYREGFYEIAAALKERPGAGDPKSMLPIATALNDLPPMAVSAIKPSQLRIEPGSIFLPLKADGKDAEFFFDTGAGISVIGESEAQELGLALKATDGKMGDASGHGVTGLKIALVQTSPSVAFILEMFHSSSLTTKGSRGAIFHEREGESLAFQCSLLCVQSDGRHQVLLHLAFLSGNWMWRLVTCCSITPTRLSMFG